LWIGYWLTVHNNCRLVGGIIWIVITSTTVTGRILIKVISRVTGQMRARRQTYRIILLRRRYLCKSATVGIKAAAVSARKIGRVSLTLVSDNHDDQDGRCKVFVPFKGFL
jgi:hypothetical protein